MIHFCTDADYDVTLEKLAELLRSLLQPAQAAVPAIPTPDWSTAPDWAQWHAVDEDGRAFWFERQPRAMSSQWDDMGGLWVRHAAPNPYPNTEWYCTLSQRQAKSAARRPTAQPATMFAPAVNTPTYADLLAAIAAYQRYTAALRQTNNNQEGQIDGLRVQLQDALTEADILRRQLDDANAQCGSLAADLAAMTTYRAQADAQRQAATEAAQRADAAEARWAAIPWRSIDIVLGHHVFTSAGAKVAAWYDANRPTAQAQD